jgi:hypothetical protein
MLGGHSLLNFNANIYFDFNFKIEKKEKLEYTSFRNKKETLVINIVATKKQSNNNQIEFLGLFYLSEKKKN